MTAPTPDRWPWWLAILAAFAALGGVVSGHVHAVIDRRKR